MTRSLKKIADQVMVVTGASSGIGLATAIEAARRGAAVVLSSRNEPALREAVARIRAAGGRATHAVADVSRREELEVVAGTAIREFGGFDTWVNNAGIGIFGRLMDVSEEDGRRLFDVNFWGVVHGTRIAAGHLREKGGAIVNLGSVVSDVAMPMQGFYSASKHAIKGFTDAFRMEMMERGAPVSVTLIKPSAIDTPFGLHAKNYLSQEAKLPPPLYRPDDVADAILHAAQHGGRDYYVGGGGKLVSSLNKHFPGVLDRVAARTTRGMSSFDRPARPESRIGTLFEPGRDGEVRGNSPHHVMRSAYTRAAIHPVRAGAALLGAGLLGLMLLDAVVLGGAVVRGRVRPMR